MDLQEMLEMAIKNGGKLTIDFGATDKDMMVKVTEPKNNATVVRLIDKETGAVDNSDFDKEHAGQEQKGETFADFAQSLLEENETEPERGWNTAIEWDNELDSGDCEREYTPEAEPESEHYQRLVAMQGTEIPVDSLPTSAKAVIEEMGYKVSEVRAWKKGVHLQITDLEGNDIQEPKKAQVAPAPKQEPWYSAPKQEPWYSASNIDSVNVDDRGGYFPRTVEQALVLAINGKKVTQVNYSAIWNELTSWVPTDFAQTIADQVKERAKQQSALPTQVINNGCTMFVKQFNALLTVPNSLPKSPVADSISLHERKEFKRVCLWFALVQHVDSAEKLMELVQLMGKDKLEKGITLEKVCASKTTLLISLLDSCLHEAFTGNLKDSADKSTVTYELFQLNSGMYIYYPLIQQTILSKVYGVAYTELSPKIEEYVAESLVKNKAVSGKEISDRYPEQAQRVADLNKTFKENTEQIKALVQFTHDGGDNPLAVALNTGAEWEIVADSCLKNAENLKQIAKHKMYSYHSLVQLGDLLEQAIEYQEIALLPATVYDKTKDLSTGVLQEKVAILQVALIDQLQSAKHSLNLAVDNAEDSDVEDRAYDALDWVENYLERLVDTENVDTKDFTEMELAGHVLLWNVEQEHLINQLQTKFNEEFPEYAVEFKYPTVQRKVTTGEQLGKNLRETAIVTAYKQGQTLTEIKTCYNLSSGSLYSILAKHGVNLKQQTSSKVAKRVANIENDRVRLSELFGDYEDNKMTLSEIYDKYELYKNGLFYLLDKYGVPRRGLKKN